jgi:putative pyruvate formate lyase activating enzyme
MDLLKKAEKVAHIYLPDFKYVDKALARALSFAPDYPVVALNAIEEMLRQKGFLDVTGSGGTLARKGVLVRHLILPGKIQNSLDALTTLYIEFGAHLPVSLMSQYWPVLPQKDEAMNRLLRRDEFDEVYGHARDLGFQHLYVQFPESENQPVSRNSFLPDFQQDEPFTRIDIGRPGC